VPQSNQRGIETRIRNWPMLRALRAPQSNQRGIETFIEPIGDIVGHQPQSNQRGIETPVVEGGAARRGVGLNRTSVGLKPRNSASPSSPQLGLNRTSVGLKRARPGAADPGSGAPQSNQRGIETHGRLRDPGRDPGPQSNQRGIETLSHCLH